MNEAQVANTPALNKLELPAQPDNVAIKRAVAAYPEVFRQRVRPLKIGIRWDLVEAGAPDKAVRAALEAYTSTQEYYKACRLGAKRYDMHGDPVGAVSIEEQAYADQCLAILDLIAACGRSDE